MFNVQMAGKGNIRDEPSGTLIVQNHMNAMR